MSDQQDHKDANVQKALQNMTSESIRAMSKEDREVLKRAWLNTDVTKKPLTRVRFPGDHISSGVSLKNVNR